MKCPRCQHDNRPGAKFCEECAAALVRLCGNCGAEVGPTAKFCSECAHPTAVAPAAPAARLGAPDSYTPRHLAERILTSRAALEGERKQVTVLFADLKGSMELLADRDPEEARKLLDPVLERMMEAVHRYEGTVNQVMGDGIMALFGAPLACEDHAVRACYAALRMQETVKRYADGIRRAEGFPLQIRVGLNSGEVVVRAIGSDLHMDYTAVGQTTHVAARMEQMALPGSTLLSADTLALAEGYVEVRSLGPLPIKGLEAPLEVYELTRAATIHSRFQAAAVSGLTRFVGRESELEQLRQALERARAGHGQVVAVVGQPGVGKSRLFWEFTHSDRMEGCLVFESGSVSYSKATLYLPVIDLLKAYFQIEDRDESRKIREKVTGKLLALDRALEPLRSALLALLDVPVEDPQWEALDPPQRRQRTLEAVKRLLLRESQVQPLVLVMEDLHWIDSETQAVLDSLVESLPGARVLLLVNYRPEYQHPWGSKTYYTQLGLDPLPPESAEELLDALLGDDPALQPLTQRLIARTEGNPFFLEESVRTLVETNALAGQRGAYRLGRPLESIQVPATVQAVLAARIDRLPAEEKRLLQSAAVVGKDVPFALLQAIAEGPEEALRQGLAHLQAAEFLYETTLFPDLEYAFKHALTHEVAYGSLLQEQRRALHVRIVETIEQLFTDRLVEHVERQAHHALRGELWGKAVTYLRQAGGKAASRSAYREAATWFEQALTALGRLPETRETIEQAIDLRGELSNSLWPVGEIDRMAHCLAEAEALATALGDQLRLGRVSAQRSRHFYVTGQQDRAVESGRRALAIARALRNLPLEVAATFYLGGAHFLRGEYLLAIDFCRRNLQMLRGDLARERFGLPGLATVLSRMILTGSLGERGEFTEGTSCGEEAIRLAEAADHPVSMALAHFFSGFLCLRQGDLQRALRPLERCLELCRLGAFMFLVPQTASALGSAYALLGRTADTGPLLLEAQEREARMSGVLLRPLVHVWVGEARLHAGLLDEAFDSATRALAIARESRERGHEGWALRLLGEVVSHRDNPNVEKAEGYYREALTLAEHLGMRPLAAHCYFAVGTLYRRTGKRQQAQEPLTTATAMYREMDMRFRLKQAEAEMKELA
jgi:class 3 adenylate cyclase/tetratricopeptide (TPR) repeat protein